ncbi:tetratricopeptide repeat protein [Fibrella sp. WM1]|uniref:tetratricopeptide repeat protein n=1 Tax=Fibrella musci TaxID=3242485 RepID=UPI0035220EFC
MLIATQAQVLVGQNLTTKAYKQYSIKQLDSAAVSFQTLATADSTQPDVRAMLSAIYCQTKRYDDASREATAALALAPKSACYWTLLGDARWGQGLTDQALRAYLRSLDLLAEGLFQPSHTISVLRAVMPYRQIEKQVNELIASSKATAQHYVLLGYAMQMQSRFQESLAAYQKAVTMQPDQMEVYLFISELHRAAKQTQLMLDAYEQAVAHDPFISSKLYKAAIQDYTESLRKEAGSFAYFALGYIHEKGLGTPVNLTEAQKWYAYAEQMHNHIAAVKLTRLYERGAIPGVDGKAEIHRIQQNRDAGRRSHTIEFKLANGNYQTAAVFVETYPADKAKPYAAESRRLNEVYGTSVDLYSLIPLERPIEPAITNVPAPQQDQLAAAAPLTASLMASPLLSHELSASATKVAQPTIGKAKLAQVFNQRVEPFLEPFAADSVASVMNQTLADYLGDVAHSPILAIQRLREDLITNRADQGFLYYAIAFLQEQLNGSSDWTSAEKWYTYAFQLHYTPAYQRLKRRYSQEALSPVKLARLDKNWQNGATEIPLTLETPEGDVKTVSVYVQDNMGSSPEPIANEVSRLLDLFGVEVPQQTVERFNMLYREARQSNLSYQDLCRQAFLNKS